MNRINFTAWSERQQVAAVILMAGVLIFAAWFFALLPLSRERHNLEKRIENARNLLASKNLLLDEDALHDRKAEEVRNNDNLAREWTNVVNRVQAFSSEGLGNIEQVGHIDFKVALFEVRNRLLRKARDSKIALPRDLGMDSSVTSDEDARKLMLQLRALEKAVDLALDLKIATVKRIQPQPAVPYALSGINTPFLEEYPVTIEFQGTMENVYNLFHAILDPEHVLALRQLKIETASVERPGLVDVTAVMSALSFPANALQLMPTTEEVKVRPSGPKGH